MTMRVLHGDAVVFLKWVAAGLLVVAFGSIAISYVFF